MEMLSRQGLRVSEAEIRSLESEYGLDLPLYAQYLKWMWKLLQGDLGRSFNFNQPVSELLAERLPLTVVISILTLIFVYGVGIPIGVYSATHQYSAGDYAVTVLGFAGLATPNFLLALVLMFMFYSFFGFSAGGAVLARVHHRPLECGQGVGPAQAPADSHCRHRHRRNREHHTGHAGHAAGRARQAVRHHGPRQGCGGRTSCCSSIR